MKPRVDTAPPPTDPVLLTRYHLHEQVALERLGRASWSGKGWLTTGECDVPGWVMKKLLERGLVWHRKACPASPNEWRLR